jgi:Protein of unknown function (DUF2934)
LNACGFILNLEADARSNTSPNSGSFRAAREVARGVQCGQAAKRALIPEGTKMATSTRQRADSGQSERVELAARDVIALREYERFEERGREPGRDVDDWLRAEHELKQTGQQSDPY